MALSTSSVWISILLLHFVIITTCAASSTDGRWCFECADVSNPAECGHVRKCETDQQCFAEKFDTSMGFPKYNSGCEDDTICHRFNKREYYNHQVGDISVCKSCCNNTDGCNGEMCHAQSLIRGRTLCFNCMGASSPETCQNVMMCRIDEVCSWTKRPSLFYNQAVYDMGCLRPVECLAKNDTYCCTEGFCNAVKDFDCQDGHSIPRSKMCNGIDDCPQGRDEKDHVSCHLPKVVG